MASDIPFAMGRLCSRALLDSGKELTKGQDDGPYPYIALVPQAVPSATRPRLRFWKGFQGEGVDGISLLHFVCDASRAAAL